MLRRRRMRSGSARTIASKRRGGSLLLAGRGSLFTSPADAESDLGYEAWTSRFARLHRALRPTGLPEWRLHAPAAGIEAAITQCRQSFPRPLEWEGRHHVRLQLP